MELRLRSDKPPLTTADKPRAEAACRLCRGAKKEDRRSKGGLEGF